MIGVDADTDHLTDEGALRLVCSALVEEDGADSPAQVLGRVVAERGELPGSYEDMSDAKPVAEEVIEAYA